MLLDTCQTRLANKERLALCCSVHLVHFNVEGSAEYCVHSVIQVGLEQFLWYG